MTAGRAAADRLLARHGRPPEGGPVCTRCRQPAQRVVAAYWDPAGTRLCPPCTHEVAAGFGPDPTNWPARPGPQEATR